VLIGHRRAPRSRVSRNWVAEPAPARRPGASGALRVTRWSAAEPGLPGAGAATPAGGVGLGAGPRGASHHQTRAQDPCLSVRAWRGVRQGPCSARARLEVACSASSRPRSRAGACLQRRQRCTAARRCTSSRSATRTRACSRWTTCAGAWRSSPTLGCRWLSRMCARWLAPSSQRGWQAALRAARASSATCQLERRALRRRCQCHTGPPWRGTSAHACTHVCMHCFGAARVFAAPSACSTQNGMGSERPARTRPRQASLFTDKAALFLRSAFVIGYDTAVRLVAPRYYGRPGGPPGEDAAEMLLQVRIMRARFLFWHRVCLPQRSIAWLPLSLARLAACLGQGERVKFWVTLCMPVCCWRLPQRRVTSVCHAINAALLQMSGRRELCGCHCAAS